MEGILIYSRLGGISNDDTSYFNNNFIEWTRLICDQNELSIILVYKLNEKLLWVYIAYGYPN